MMLIPTGMSAAANPCSARPAITVANVSPTATSTAPAVIVTRATTTIRRLPTMSANRDTIGVATAPLRIVIVTAHEAVVGLTPRMSGRSGISGTTSVCCSAASIPASERTVMTDPLRRGAISAMDTPSSDARRRSEGHLDPNLSMT